MKYLVVAILFVSITTYAKDWKKLGGAASGYIGAMPTTTVVTPVTTTATVAGETAVAAGSTGTTTSVQTSKSMAKHCGTNYGCWVLVGLAAYQGVEFFRSGQSNDNVCTSSTETGSACNPTAAFNDSGLNGNGGNPQDSSGRVGSSGKTYGPSTGPQSFYGKYPEMKKIDEQLKQNGVSVDMKNGNITTPNGTFTQAQLGTSAGLAAAGVTSKDLQLAQEISKEASKQMEKIAARQPREGYEGGGRTGGPANAPAAEGDHSLDDLMKKMNRGPASATKDSLSGLSVMHNGEPVGVAQSNIFETVNRRYKILQMSGTVGTQNH